MVPAVTAATQATGRPVLAVDLGGTKLALACVTPDLRVLRRATVPAPKESAEALVAELCDQLRRLDSACGPASALGIGTASMLSGGRVIASTHLPLRDVDLRAEMEGRLGLPVVIDNDGTLAALAEHRLGAGRGSADMVMVSIGTGIAGGIVSGGRLVRGLGAAGEFGHMTVDTAGPECAGDCPGRGCLEMYVSGLALARAARRIAAAEPDSAFAAAVRGRRLPGPIITSLAAAGDGPARAIYEDMGRMLGWGLVSIVNILNPELVVIGGAVAQAGELLLAPARRVLAAHGLKPHRDQVRVVEAELGEQAALIGAAVLALELTAP